MNFYFYLGFTLQMRMSYLWNLMQSHKTGQMHLHAEVDLWMDTQDRISANSNEDMLTDTPLLLPPPRTQLCVTSGAIKATVL